jgi:integrase
MAKRLTAVAVANFKPRKRRREIPDGGCPGLFLIVQPSGVKSWALRFRRPRTGQAAKLTLGRVDVVSAAASAPVEVGRPLSLTAARRLAADLQHRRALGEDVAAEALAEKRRRRLALDDADDVDAFGRASRDYIQRTRAEGRRSWRDAATFLGLDASLEPFAKGLADRWRDKPISEIDAGDVYKIVDEVRRRGVPGRPRRSAGETEGMARSMHAILSGMFKWLWQQRRVDANPVAQVAKPRKAAARDRVLDDDEIVKLWRATERLGEPFGSIYRLLVLTGCRLDEVRQMRWGELKDDGATLSLPAERTKNKKPHDVFLSPAARAIVAAQPRIADSPLVFTGRTGATAVSGLSKAKARLDRLMTGVGPWRTHDVRRSVASGLQRLGVPLPVTEKILGHESGSFAGIVGVYQRHEYRAERRAAMEGWARHVEGLVSGRADNVERLPLPRRA